MGSMHHLCDNLWMLQFHSNASGDTPYKLHQLVKAPGLALQQIGDRMKADYELLQTPSAPGYCVARGTIHFQGVVHLPADCRAFGPDEESLPARMDGFVLGFEDHTRALPGS